MNSYRLFTKHQLDNLRKEYDRVEGIDPNTNGYKLLTSFLDSQPQNVLAQLAGANIKFLSKLARNRVQGVCRCGARSPDRCVNPPCDGRHANCDECYSPCPVHSEVA